MTQYDVIIVGAGPAGCSTALSLEGSGLSIALIDKSSFPRDKICGDALSPDVVNQLNMLPLDTGALFSDFSSKIWCKAVRFVSPNFDFADVSLNHHDITGYVSTRLDFDQFMFEQAEKSTAVTTYTGKRVDTINRNEQQVTVLLGDGTQLSAPIILGADGAHSIVGKQLAGTRVDKKHYCAGLRQYWEGVSGFSSDNAVELHFYKDLLPGYFWIFPLPNGRANVGIGMLSDFVSKRNINLKEKLTEIIAEHPNVKGRFSHAKPLEDIKGFGLPLGGKKRVISGDNYLLLGDAASLINPLSGEGIGNAIRSGRVAADHIKSVSITRDYSSKSNVAYDREIYRRMWGELRLNYWIQVVMRNPRLCNFIVKRAIGSNLVQNLIISGFSAKTLRQTILGHRS